MDKYAIIIVTYNRKRLLEECIKNALNQTIPADKIVIVNNASTDGTTEYLKSDIFKNEKFNIVHCEKNTGGAGGFNEGMRTALNYDIDWMLVIDDDAILNTDYTEKIFLKLQTQRSYQAAAGIVMTNGNINRNHRKRLSRFCMGLKPLKDSFYQKETFVCDIVSFCGMMVKKDLVEKIGLPHKEYFIFHDDVEYSLRVLKYSRFLIVTDAILDHKINFITQKCLQHYTWKDYYEIRNRFFYVREHGNAFDYVVTILDALYNKIFKNWILGIIKYDGYDWKRERDIAYRAIRDGMDEENYVRMEKY